MNPQDIQTPASPLGNFPELAGMYRSSFQAPLSNAQTGSQANADQITVANQKAAAAEAHAKAIAALDPSKYQVIQKPDGGYKFISPNGNEVTAAQYAAVAKTTPDKILRDSQNPIDVQYQQDFGNLQTLGKAIVTGDSTTVQKYYSKNPALKGLSYDQLVSHFKQAYPTVYGQGGFLGAGTAGQGVGSTYVPTVSSSSSGLDALLQQYGIGQ